MVSARKSTPLRCALACGARKGPFSLLTRHLFLSARCATRKRTGLLSFVPGGTGVLRTRACCISHRSGKSRIDTRRFAGCLLFCAGAARYESPQGFAWRDCTVRRENSLMLHGDAVILGILPLPLASPSASSGAFVVGQDDRGKKARRGPNSLRSPVLKSMGWARTLIRT